MQITLRQFIRKHIPIQWLKEELEDMNMPQGGTKDVLIDKVLRAYELRNQDFREFLITIYKDDLKIICEEMDLDTDGTVEQLVRRIWKNIRPEDISSDSQVLIGGTSHPEEKAHLAEDGGSPSKTVFIVHGRDSESRLELADLLRSIGLQPRILHEEANQGMTLIEKLESKGEDVGFVFVLLTPDDMGGRVNESQRPRARQNVVFELGYFMGRLRRRNVCCLIKGEVERPSDIDGLVYLPYEKSVRERLYEIIKELRKAGYKISFD